MGRKLWGVYQVVACWLFTTVFCSVGSLLLLLTFRVFSYSLAARLLRIYGRGMCWLSRVEVVVEGKEHLETAAPCVIVMNHTSIIDIFVISSHMPLRLVVVGKKEMLWVPFIGQFYWLMRFITVDRKNSLRAVASMKRANRLIAENNLRVLVAPEGTRTKDGSLGPFKKGAFFTAMELGCPVVSMVMAGSYALHPSGQLSTTPGRVRIRVLAPMDSSTFTRENLQHKADELRDQMGVALDEMYASDPKIYAAPPGRTSEEQNP
jgi:1-acyl-sn-glycerol-3-phosphate acyltransferase